MTLNRTLKMAKKKKKNPPQINIQKTYIKSSTKTLRNVPYCSQNGIELNTSKYKRINISLLVNKKKKNQGQPFTCGNDAYKVPPDTDLTLL